MVTFAEAWERYAAARRYLSAREPTQAEIDAAVADGKYPPPEPFCSSPEKCAGLSRCPREIVCND